MDMIANAYIFCYLDIYIKNNRYIDRNKYLT